LETLIAGRQSPVQKVEFPQNNGVSRLFTYSNKLVAVTQDNLMYAWNWSNLNGKPTVSNVDADQAVFR
jgi:hypothetical protein